ncbi:hypothetical protein INR49_025324 [Caranx melampygus]|nr:hypothetical protein INR49_025324 [Caranx melampygus]
MRRQSDRQSGDLVLGGCVAGLEWLTHMVLRSVPAPCLNPYAAGGKSQVGQNFTFVLTDIDSKQRFGFCRLTQGCRVCICLLSYLPWFEIYYKLLNTLADYLTNNRKMT